MTELIERGTGLHRVVASATKGRVLVAGDDGYEEAAMAWNLAMPQRPFVVAEALDGADVSSLVRAAAGASLTVTAQPVGHGATSDMEGLLLIRTAALDEIWIDADARVARVGAGVRWGSLLAALDGTGLIALAGSNPEVSVVGYLLGGGLSWFGRRYGIASGSLRAVELTDPSGRPRWVTDQDDPDLMWALRGGGGEFGIVTQVEIDLFPEPELHGGKLTFDITAAADVFAAFNAVCAEVGDDVTLWASILHLPDLPVLPPPIRGRSLVTVDALGLDGAEPLADALSTIQAVGDLLTDTTGLVRVSELGRIAEEPTDPTPGIEHAVPIAEFGPDTQRLVLDMAADRSRTALASLQVRHLGSGFAAARDRRPGAVDRLSAEFLVHALGVPMDPMARQAVTASLSTVATRLRDRECGLVPPTFLGGRPTADAYFPATLERLHSIKSAVDPDGRFRGNRPLDVPSAARGRA